MAGKERLISQETTRKLEIGGVIAGLIGIVVALASPRAGMLLEAGGFGTAAVAGGYDIYQYMKNRKK